MEIKNKFVGKDMELLSLLQRNDHLRDGKILRFDIFQRDWKVNVDVYINMRPKSKFGVLMLRFSECKEYELYWARNYAFYDIETIKFFSDENGLFYASFAPYDESEIKSEDDLNFILSHSVSAYEIKKKGEVKRGDGGSLF